MSRIPFALALAAALAAPLAAQGPTRAAPGKQVPEFSFSPFQYGDGRQQLSEFFGQPVLIEFWGIH